MKIYVGNINYRTTEEGLHELFSQYGTVDEVAVISDRETGRARGFAFVTMSDDEEARKAIEAINGMEYDSRTLTVNEARPRTGGGGGFGGGGFGGRSGGRGGFGSERGGGGGRGGRDRDRDRGEARQSDDW